MAGFVLQLLNKFYFLLQFFFQFIGCERVRVSVNWFHKLMWNNVINLSTSSGQIQTYPSKFWFMISCSSCTCNGHKLFRRLSRFAKPSVFVVVLIAFGVTLGAVQGFFNVHYHSNSINASLSLLGKFKVI